MQHTRISIGVHRAHETSETSTFTDTDITLGSSHLATIHLSSVLPFHFTLIHVDRETGKTFFQFTDTMRGELHFADVNVSLSDLKKLGAECVLLLGLWIVELPSDTTGHVWFEDVELTFLIQRIAKTFTGNAA